MKLQYRILVGVIVCTFSVELSAGTYGGGTGTADDPYQIASAQHIYEMSGSPEDWSSCFILTEDIDLDPATTGGGLFERAPVSPDEDIQTEDYQGTPFSGIFDGAGRVIRGLTIIGSNRRDFIGLFGCITDGGVVRNLRMEAVFLCIGRDCGVINHLNSQGEYIGGIAGANCGGVLEDVSVEGSIQGDYYVGGLVGLNDQGTITGCCSVAEVTANNTAGGLVGVNSGIINNCFSEGTVNADILPGGFVGSNSLGTIMACFSQCNVYTPARSTAAGFVAYNYRGRISGCYSTGGVSSDESISGGFVGHNIESHITECYSTSPLWSDDGDRGLGFVRYNKGVILNCFWDVEASMMATSDGGVGKTTVQMKDARTYACWSHAPVGWTIENGVDYPRLAWEGHSGQRIGQAPPPWQGSGLTADPYLINSVEDFVKLSELYYFWDKAYRLTADLDMNQITYDKAPIAADHWSWAATDTFEGFPFTGSFDGNGFCIRNLTVEGKLYCGLFGYLGEGASVSNLLLEGADISAGSGGALAGYCSQSTISNVSVSGAVNGTSKTAGMIGTCMESTITNCRAEVSGRVSGGLVAFAENSTVTACCTQVDIAAYDYAGGLIGEQKLGTVFRCTSVGTLRCQNDRSSLGGLVAHNLGGVISECFSTCSASAGRYSTAGGLVSGNSGMVSGCYATGDISADWYAGGLVGNNGGQVLNSYSVGRVSPTLRTFGGLVGAGDDGGVYESFWDIETSGVQQSFGGTGRTTQQMHLAQTFSFWQHYPIMWTIRDGKDYPRLAWERLQGMLIGSPTPFAGRGTDEDPYLLFTVGDLIAVNYFQFHDKCFKLMQDVDMSGFLLNQALIAPNINPNPEEGYQGFPFAGQFNGNGHAIQNLRIEANTDYCGLFGKVETGAKIQNLRLENILVHGPARVGGLGGSIGKADIDNVHIAGFVSGTGAYVGGMAGGIRYANVSACSFYGTVEGDKYVAGLVGLQDHGLVDSSWSDGEVTGISSRVGGIIGGASWGTTTNCYSHASVSGNSDVGGFIGYCDKDSMVRYCYSTGRTTGVRSVGGFCGFRLSEPSISLSFWDTQTGGRQGSAGGYGRTTSQMKKRSTFVLWGIEDKWTILENKDYPRLSWENKLGIPMRKPVCWDGQGTAEAPYLIRDAEDLLALRDAHCQWNKCFKLTADVSLSGHVFETAFLAWDLYEDPYYDSSFEGVAFAGTLDGDGYTLADLTIDTKGKDTRYLGLAGWLTGTIRNLNLSNAAVLATKATDYAGVIAGYSEGYIESCHVAGSVTAWREVGGLVGKAVDGTIKASSFGGQIEGGYRVGGLVGHLGGTANVVESASNSVIEADRNIGGIAGELHGAQIRDSYASGILNMPITYGYQNGGGLVGYASSNLGIVRCYSTCELVSPQLSSSWHGGLVGRPENKAVQDCFWDIEVSGIAWSAVGIGKSTQEMMTPQTFLDTGWDLIGEPNNGADEIWGLHRGKDYPRLWWEFENVAPQANAGADCTAYAWFDGYAEVRLDGSGSSDADEDVLDYFWQWKIAGEVFEAEGVCPSIRLPAGVFEVTLIVSDGIVDSAADTVSVRVEAPVEATMLIEPRTLGSHSQGRTVMALLTLPASFAAADVDMDQGFTFYPGEVEAASCRSLGKHGRHLFILFDRASVLSALGEVGDHEVAVAGRMKTGQWLFAEDTIRITGPPRREAKRNSPAQRKAAR